MAVRDRSACNRPLPSRLLWVRRQRWFNAALRAVSIPQTATGRRRGRPHSSSERMVLSQIIVALLEGGGWNWPSRKQATDDEAEHPSGSQCLRRLRSWQQSGVWERLLDSLRAEADTATDAAEIHDFIARLEVAAVFRRSAHKRPNRKRAASPALPDPSHLNDRSGDQME